MIGVKKIPINEFLYYNKMDRYSRGDIIMSNEDKLSIHEKAQEYLDRKKQAQTNNKNITNVNGSSQRMKSQLTKRPSNTRRKMGS